MMESEKPEDLKLVEKHVQALGEHFETVQIYTTRHESGLKDGTTNINAGSGNWFARFGQVREWLIKEEERSRENVRENK